MAMDRIRAVLEPDDGEAEPIKASFTPEDVLTHNKIPLLPSPRSAWMALPENERQSLAEDFALWNFCRRSGDQREFHVEVTLPD